MKTRLLFLTAAALPLSNAFVSSLLGRRPSFVGSSAALTTKKTKADWEGDLESEFPADPLVEATYKPLQHLDSSAFTSIEKTESKHGMPWKESIDAEAFQGEELLFMPFWEWQMSFMKDHLTDLKSVACTNGKTDFSYNCNEKKKARIVNLCATSKEYRKIRMTYFDVGENTQVFNSVWYPDPASNLPILGMDLLAFGRKKYLAVVDFQPLHESEDQHGASYEHLLRPIKDQYESLKGTMSAKFYDEAQFFSKELLFARFEDESVISNDLFPAFQAYLQTHVDLVKSTPRDLFQAPSVLERQKAYDVYSAERDPAAGLFSAMFGAQWASDYIHDFLFPMSQSPREGGSFFSAATIPSCPFGAGPSQARNGTNSSKKQLAP